MCKDDANAYHDMHALQILEIWMFLKQARTACFWLFLPAYCFATYLVQKLHHPKSSLNNHPKYLWNMVIPQNSYG